VSRPETAGDAWAVAGTDCTEREPRRDVLDRGIMATGARGEEGEWEGDGDVVACAGGGVGSMVDMLSGDVYNRSQASSAPNASRAELYRDMPLSDTNPVSTRVSVGKDGY
jgi:hypothetical protein